MGSGNWGDRAPVLALLAAAVWAAGGKAQTLDNAALTGKYYFVQLLATASGGQATNVQNLSGAITFNGNGGYNYAGKTATLSGTYAVQPSGTVSLQNPIQTSLQITARLSGDRNVLAGASTDAVDNTNDFFVAIKAPAGAVGNSVLSGAYSGVALEFPGGQSPAMNSSWIALSPAGNGQFTQVRVNGHAVDHGSTNISQSAAGSSYTVNNDGTGTVNFGSQASLLSGTREIFVSQDGNYVIGDPTGTASRGLFLAIRNASGQAGNGSLSGRYWIAEMTMVGQGTGACSSFDFEDASGAFQAFGNGAAMFSERTHVDTRTVDFTGLNAYSVNADGTGELAPFLQGITNMAIGTGSVLGAQIGAPNTTSCMYGIFFGVQAPSFTATGSAPFLNPVGVLNAASFAPFPNPASPGAVTSLFGTNLAPVTVAAQAFPLTTSLGGVTVTVNGQPAPIYYVSPTQINIQTPFEAAGSNAAIQVTSNGAASNVVTVPLSATSPGLFQYADGGDAYRAVAQHLNGTLVSAARPASVRETIVLYAVGLGALQPAVASGAANPASPLAQVADPHVQIVIGGEIASNVQFLGGAPGFPGLYQINVQIPSTVLPGPNVPIEIVTSNADSDIVDIPIGM